MSQNAYPTACHELADIVTALINAFLMNCTIAALTLSGGKYKRQLGSMFNNYINDSKLPVSAQRDELRIVLTEFTRDRSFNIKHLAPETTKLLMDIREKDERAEILWRTASEDLREMTNLFEQLLKRVIPNQDLESTYRWRRTVLGYEDLVTAILSYRERGSTHIAASPAFVMEIIEDLHLRLQFEVLGQHLGAAPDGGGVKWMYARVYQMLYRK